MTYVGVRGRQGCLVRIYDRERGTDYGPLPPRLDLANYSPDGFEWGYGGSGPAQLALALLAQSLGDDRKALAFYQDFKAAVVARFDTTTWELSDAEIAAEVAAIEKARSGGIAF